MLQRDKRKGCISDVTLLYMFYRYTGYLVAQWHFQMTRLELFYILHIGTCGPWPRVREFCQCVFAALCCLEIKPQSMLLSNRAGKLNWVAIKILFFLRINLYVFSLKKNLEVQSVQFNQMIFSFFFSMMVKPVHNIHIQNHFGQVCIPKILLFFLF